MPSRRSSLLVLVCSLILAALLMTGVAWRQSGADEGSPDKQMGVMVEVCQHIADDYVTTPNLAKVSSGGLHGLVASLDADSSYLDPSEYQQYETQQANPPTGTVQAVFSKRVGYAAVVDVQPSGEAAKAGLKRGDFVEAVEGVGTREMSLADLRMRLAGEPGTKVTISVVHLHQSDPVNITLTRVAPNPAPLGVEMKDGIGIIAVPNFDTGRAAQIAGAVGRLRAQGAHAFILDLRNCGAGDYNQAEQAANVFLDHGTITYLEGQKFPRVTTTADPAKTVDAQDSLKVLVNFGTFGPAEVAAAALQQNDRAQLIGDSTFGEGSLQRIIPVGDGAAVLLTVARYYSPKGKAIQDGITPNLEQVRYAGALPGMDYPPEGVTGPLPDLQMQKAISLLTAPAASAAATGGNH